MSTSIEQRVVQMRFDNKQFESGVAQSMSTLDKLKAKLNFKGSTQGFEDIQRAVDKVNLQTIGDQADKVGIKFDALRTVAEHALTRMTDAAITAGKRMVMGLSVDQITAGWTKYEQKTGSVQTIMNATGKSIDQVNKYLDKLMWFSDETSYGFNDMTAAIGQLTSAGGDIDKLVPMVMGIANATAFAGKGVNEFSRAIYNLNQSYSAGALQYMDWKSLELAGVASKQLKEVFIQTAEEMGKVEKGSITIANFGETLKKKWADTEVMEKAFGKFGEMTEKAYEMVNSGMVETASEAYEILSQTYDGFSITAAKAAQEAKSFAEAVDATKDAVSSGWMKTFEIIFGNYEEAKKLWTDLANTMWDIFASGADARNEMLESWKLMGGRASLLKGITRLWQALSSVLEIVKSAFKDIFPPITAKQLYVLTNQFSAFMAELQLSPEALNTLRVAFKALLLPVKAVVTVLEIAGYWMVQFAKKALDFGDALLSIPSKVKPFESSLKKIFGDDRYERLAKSLTTIVGKLGDAFSVASKYVGEAVINAQNFASSRFGSVMQDLAKTLTPIAEWILDRIVDGIEALANADYSGIVDWAKNGLQLVVDGFERIRSGASGAVSAVIDFFKSFKAIDPVSVFNALINGIINLKKNIHDFIKGIGITPILNSIRTEVKGVTDVIASLGEALGNVLSKLTPGKILVFSFGVSILGLVNAMTKAVTAFASIEKVFTSVSGVFNNLSGVLKTFQDRMKPDQFRRIAISLAILAGSLVALSLVDSEKLRGAVQAMLWMAGAFGVLIAAMAAVDKFLLDGGKAIDSFAKMGQAMIMMSGSIAILAGALLLLNKVDLDGLGWRLLALGGVMVVMVGLSAVLSKAAPELTKGAGFLLIFALSIGLVVNSLEKLGRTDLSNVQANVMTLLVIMGLLAGLSAASRHVKFGSAAGLTLFIIDLLLFVKVLQKISDVDVAGLAQGIMMFTAMLLALIPMAVISKVAGKEMAGAGVAILSMSASMIILAQAIRMIGDIDPQSAVRGTIMVGFILTLFAAILKVAQVAEKGSKVAQPSFLAMSLSIMLLAVAIDYIGGIELKKVVQGGIVVSAILALFAILTKVAGEAKGATGAITAMAVALGLITTSLMLLTLIPFSEIMGAAVALGTALVALGVTMKLMSGMDLKTAFGSIGMLLSVILAISYIVNRLKEFDTDDVLKIAGSIGLILVSLGASMALLQSTMGKGNVANLGQTLFFMVGMLTTSAIIFSIVSAMPYTEGLLEKATGLSMVLLALAGAMKIVRVTTAKPENITKTLGMILGMLAMATAAFAILTYLPLGEGMIEKAVALSTILMALSGATAILAAMAPGLISVGKSWGAALKGLATIAIGLVGLTALVVLAGAVFSQIEGLEPILDAAEYGLSRIGMILGEFVGNIIGGIGVGITDGFPKIAQNLSDFAENVKPFLELEVDSSVVSAIGSLVTVVGQLSGASFIDGITTMLTLGHGGLATFGSKLEEFAPHFRAFCDEIQNIKVGPVNAAARAMEGIGAMLDAIPTEGGIFEFFTGNKSLKSFGEGLQEFAPGFVAYCDAIADANSISAAVGTTKNVASCVKTLADSIPKSGGLLQGFFGEQDMSKFGGQLADFANGLQEFFKIVTGQAPDTVEVDLDIVRNCANVSKVLGEFAKTIPSAGGALQDFFGTKDIGKFGEQLATFAEGLMGFFTKIDEETISDDAVEQAIKIGGAFRDFAATLPADNGFIQQFTGSRGLDDFGSDIKNYGEALVEFFDSFGKAEITDADIELAKNAGLAFTDITNAMPKYNGVDKLFGDMDSSNFKTAIGNIGIGLFNYFQQVRQVSFETIHESVEALKDVLSLNDLMTNFTEHASDLGKYLEDIANSGIKGFIDAFDDVGDQFTNAITTAINDAFTKASTNLELYSETYDVLIDALVTGINTNIDEILIKAKEICQRFVTAIEEEWQKLESGGAFIIQSLIYGIDASQPKLVEKVKAVMVEILETVRSSLGIRGDYSEEFVEVGEQCVRGIMKGLETNESALYTLVGRMGTGIIDEMKSVLGIHSPSLEGEEIGEQWDGGVEKGMSGGSAGVANGAAELAEDMIESTEETLDVQNGASQEAAEIGGSFDVGIAQGLLESEYAEEAASTKADGIVEIFKDRFSRISEAMSVLDKEFELWSKKNPMGSYSDGVNSYSFGQGAYTQKQFELLQNKLALQAEQVNLANASYQANLAKFGAEATATREAYSTYLEAQISMADMAQSMQQMQISNQQNWRTYASTLAEVHDDLVKEGFSEEQIRNAVSNQTGWVDMNSVTQGTIDDMMTIYTEQASNVQELVSEALQSMTTTAQNSGRQAGVTTMQSFGQGAQEAAPEVKNIFTEVIKNVTSGGTDSVKADGEKTWADYVEGGLNWLNNTGLPSLEKAGKNLGQSLDDGTREGLDENSPSKKMEQNGIWAIEGLINGIDKTSENLFETATDVGTSTLTVFTDIVSEYPGVGENMMAGLAEGIYAGQSTVINAAVEVAVAALAAARAALGIASPSREFYEIGEMIDQGLANGIENGYGIVDGSISKIVNRMKEVSKDDLALRPVVEMEEEVPEPERQKVYRWLVWNSDTHTLVPRREGFSTTYLEDALARGLNITAIPVDYATWDNIYDNFDQFYDYTTMTFKDAAEYLNKPVDRMWEIAQQYDASSWKEGDYYDMVNGGRVSIGTPASSTSGNGGGSGGGGSGVTFIQNNYSPTALNNAEIQRNTNTGLANFREQISEQSK